MEYKIFESSDTNVKKFVFEWRANEITKKGIAEAVLYRYGEYSKRTVICCSVQSGCPVGCTFCGTGKFFVRNLDWSEIVEQVTTVLSTIDCDTKDIKKFQIMFMSMGEPFLNYINLERAIESLHDLYPNAQLLISTSAPSTLYYAMSEFIELSKRIPQVGLQFSVHESTDEARAKLIPTKTCTSVRLPRQESFGPPIQEESHSLITVCMKEMTQRKMQRDCTNFSGLMFGKLLFL